MAIEARGDPGNVLPLEPQLWLGSSLMSGCNRADQEVEDLGMGWVVTLKARPSVIHFLQL